MLSAYLLIQSYYVLVCLITSNCIYVCCIFDLFINLYHAVAFFAANKDVYNVSFQVVPGEHERLISIIFLHRTVKAITAFSATAA